MTFGERMVAAIEKAGVKVASRSEGLAVTW